MKEIKITSNGIKQAIDDLVNENEMLQDKVYKLEDILKEVREGIKELEYVDYDEHNLNVCINHIARILGSDVVD